MKKISKRYSERELSRLFAIMADYQLTHSSSSVEQVISDFKNEQYNYPGIDGVSFADISVDLFTELVHKIDQNRQEIDRTVKLKLDKKWTFSRMDPVIVSILRAAVCELLFFKGIPSKVIFKSYNGLAKAFLNDGDLFFISGILNAVARENRDVSEFKEETGDM